MELVFFCVFPIQKYNTFFFMNQEKQSSYERKSSQQYQQQSNDSNQFQQLDFGENNSIKKTQIINTDSNIDKYLNSNPEQQKSEKITQLEKKLAAMQNRQKQQAIRVENLEKQNMELKSLYQLSLKQIKILEGKLQKYITQNCKLKQTNIQVKQLTEHLHEQSQQYIDKINCIQKKLQLQKQQLEAKFTVIKKNLQKLTKSSIKGIDNENTFKLLINKLNETQKLLQKIYDIEEMIVEKNQKNKAPLESCDVIEEKMKSLERVQSILLKQQNRINGLKEHILRLEDKLKQNSKDQQPPSGISKWFDPVIKFCKIEEIKEKQTKKKKDNV